MDPGTLVAYAMNDQPIPAAHGFPLRLVVPGLGGRLRHQVAEQAHGRHDGARRLLGADRLPLSDQARRARRGRRRQGHGAAHRAGREVAHHPPLDGAVVPPGHGHGRRLRVGRRASTSPGSTCRWTPAPRGSRPSSPAGPKVRVAALRVRASRHARRTRTPSCRAPPTPSGAVQPIVPQWNPSGYLWNAPDQVRIEVKA